MRQTQHTLHQPSLCVEKYTLTIENDGIFDESPTESLKRAFEDNHAETKPKCIPSWPY